MTTTNRKGHLPADFGDGWLTSSARDLVKIAVCLAGFDAQDLANRLARTKSRGQRLNAATVERVLAEMRA
jgi:hypothetical protein